MKRLNAQTCLYARLQPTFGPAVWKVDLAKHGATWSYFTENEVGGGFGSNMTGTLQTALAAAVGSVPDGIPVQVTVNDEDRGVYSRVR